MRINHTMIISWRLAEYDKLIAAGVDQKDAMGAVLSLSKTTIRRRIKERSDANV